MSFGLPYIHIWEQIRMSHNRSINCCKKSSGSESTFCIKTSWRTQISDWTRNISFVPTIRCYYYKQLNNDHHLAVQFLLARQRSDELRSIANGKNNSTYFINNQTKITIEHFLWMLNLMAIIYQRKEDKKKLMIIKTSILDIFRQKYFLSLFFSMFWKE